MKYSFNSPISKVNFGFILVYSPRKGYELIVAARPTLSGKSLISQGICSYSQKQWYSQIHRLSQGGKGGLKRKQQAGEIRQKEALMEAGFQ